MKPNQGKKQIVYIRKVLATATAALMLATALGQETTVHAAESEATHQYEEADPAPQQFITTANLNFRRGPSTSYERISLLPSGTVITVTEHVPDGFSHVTVNGVSGFVSSEFIRIMDTTPSTATQSDTVAQHGNVELLSWREVRQIMPTGTRIQVYDIRSGRTYFVRNFSNGNHADVEPITQQDTDILRATFGGRWSWDPRPVLVTFGDRTIAAAINGMPHGGSTISGNGFNGHICLHFHGSTTHNGNRRYERLMQETVMEAFNSAR